MPKKIPKDFKERIFNRKEERFKCFFDDDGQYTIPECKSKKSRKKVPDEEEEIILIAEELNDSCSDSNSDIDSDDDDCLTDSIRRLKKRVYNNYDGLFVKYFKITADKNSYIDADDLHKIFSDGKYMDNSNKIVLQQYLSELGITMKQSKGYERYFNVKYKIN